MFEYVAFDIETTGISYREDAILEIGAVRFARGKPVDTFNVLVDPRRPIPPEATRVHGITNSMVKGQSTLEDALEKFSAFCRDSILVAHNAQFDMKFITEAGLREQVPLPPALVMDTFPMARTVLPDLFNYKLETLVRHFGIPQAGFHRATEDASYCGQAFIELLKQIKRNGGELKFQMLVQLSGGEHRFPIIAPKAKQMALL